MPATSAGEERQLIARVLKGEKKAFQPLVIKYSKLVFTTALRIVRNPETAEDISQEAFWQAFRCLETFRFQSSFSTWLVRITVNKSLDFCRREKPCIVLSEKQQTGYQEILTDDAQNPEEVVVKLEKDAELYKRINNLPDIYRRTILEHYMNSLSYKEIASKENVSVKTIESRIYRAKAMLKKMYPGGDNSEMPRTSTS